VKKIPYDSKLPKVEGQDPIRPKFGTKVNPPTQDKDSETHFKRKRIGSGHQAKAQDSPSGR